MSFSNTYSIAVPGQVVVVSLEQHLVTVTIVNTNCLCHRYYANCLPAYWSSGLISCVAIKGLP